MEKLSKRAKILLFCAPIIFAVALAVTLAAIMAQAGKKVDDPVVDTPSTPVNSVVETFSEGLEFESLGDGKCALAGVGKCADTIVRVPEKSPAGEVVAAVSSIPEERRCTAITSMPKSWAARRMSRWPIT